jgi:AcrR family transcriptional regulator
MVLSSSEPAPAPGSDTGPAARRRGRPGHDRAAVLRAAIDLFIAQGYDATSISDLAASLGVTKSAVYHHFPSKESLLAAALDEALEGLDAAVAEAARATDGRSAHDRLRATVLAAVRLLAEHRPAVTLLLRVRGNSALEIAALERRRRIDVELADLVAEAVAEGSVRSDLPPEVVSRLVFGTVNSLVDWYSPDGSIAPDALGDAICRLLFEGLLA